jgi:hypothetical protein
MLKIVKLTFLIAAWIMGSFSSAYAEDYYKYFKGNYPKIRDRVAKDFGIGALDASADKILPDRKIFWFFVEEEDSDKDWPKSYIFNIIVSTENGEAIDSLREKKTYDVYVDFANIDRGNYILNDNTQAIAVNLSLNNSNIDRLFLYTFQDGRLNTVLDGFEVNAINSKKGNWNVYSCSGYAFEHRAILVMSNKQTNGYNDIIVKYNNEKSTLSGSSMNDCHENIEKWKSSVRLKYDGDVYR